MTSTRTSRPTSSSPTRRSTCPTGRADPDDPRWRYGVPPAGNANFAWLQHIVYKLGSRGTAGVVLANGSMSSQQSGEGEIRAAMVEADLVACMIALPPQLFRTTQIPACLWFFAKDKGPAGRRSCSSTPAPWASSQPEPNAPSPSRT